MGSAGMLAECYLQLGRYEQAEAALSEVLGEPVGGWGAVRLQVLMAETLIAGGWIQRAGKAVEAAERAAASAGAAKGAGSEAAEVEWLVRLLLARAEWAARLGQRRVQARQARSGFPVTSPGLAPGVRPTCILTTRSF